MHYKLFDSILCLQWKQLYNVITFNIRFSVCFLPHQIYLNLFMGATNVTKSMMTTFKCVGISLQQGGSQFLFDVNWTIKNEVSLNYKICFKSLLQTSNQILTFCEEQPLYRWDSELHDIYLLPTWRLSALNSSNYMKIVSRKMPGEEFKYWRISAPILHISVWDHFI